MVNVSIYLYYYFKGTKSNIFLKYWTSSLFLDIIYFGGILTRKTFAKGSGGDT